MSVENQTKSALSPPQPVEFMQAFWFWFKLGFISFGGPAGQIALMHQELVERRRWISEKRFLHALNFCMVLPGPEAQQLATYLGWMFHRTVGGLIAGGLFVLPSLLILIGLSWIYMAYGHLAVVAGVMYAIKPAVTAIVLMAAFRIGSRALRHPLLWSIAGASFVAIFWLGVPFPLIVMMAGLIGFLASLRMPEAFRLGAGHQASPHHFGAALIDDDTPAPLHARFHWKRMLGWLALGLSIWALCMLGLGFFCGWDSVLMQMGWFFSKAALLTFGGAYAVLPYVFQGGVEQFHWLTAPQMMDGLALGETTPGPLIMVVAFIGFVGGWSHQIFGAQGLFYAGAAGALVATFFTFLPSFFFILIGGPVVESAQGVIRLTAPLTGITAAVVGVIVNLAVFFAIHVLWPQGFAGHFDVFSCILGLFSALLLFRYQWSVIRLIGVCAILGGVYSLLV